MFYLNYHDLDKPYYSVNEVSNLLHLTVDQVWAFCHRFGITPQNGEYGQAVLSCREVRSLHNHLYKKEHLGIQDLTAGLL